MDLLSLSPLPVASLIWRHGQGSWIQTVVCKCTFELCPGLARTVQRQYPICDRDRFLEDDPNRSVYAPGDLAPFKRRVDVTLVGSAFAPGGHSVERLVARLRLGPLRKGIEVLPERQWVDGKWRAGPAFARVPLWYELAAGGPGTDNPVGIPGQRSPRLPRIVPEGFDPTSSGPIPTAGFGPIGALWPSRLARLGELGEAWSETRWHDRPLPRDFDAEYFNAAPADQQLDRLAPHLVLENLHPGHPVLETYLPGLQPKAIVERRPGEQEELEMEADSVWIDTERAVWAITWRTQVVLEGRDQPGRVLVAIENVEQDRPTPTPAPAATPRPTPTPPPASARDTEPPQAPVVLRSLGQQEEHTPTGVHEDAAELTVDALSPSLSNDYPAWLRTPPPPRAGGSLPAPAAVAVPAAPPETGLRPFPATPGSLEVGPPAAPREAERPRPPTPPPRAVPPPRGERLPPGAPGSTPPPAVTPGRGDRPTPTAPASPSPPAVAPAPRLERPAPPAPASLPAAPPRDLGATERQAVELVWFAQGRLAALRRHWGELLGPEPGGAEGRAEAELTGARRDAFAVLTVPPPGGLDSLGDAIRAAVSVYERFEPPGLVLVGQIVLPFDELQTLRAAAAVLSALGATDRRVKELVGPLAELAQEPMLEGCSQAVEALLEPLRERYAQARRGAPQDSLQDHVERILLRQRAYQRRSVFGPTSIRALLVSLDGQLAVPTYLPEDAAPRLPLMTSFPARLVAELHPRQDQLEACPYALRALVLGRIFSV